jgi:hypothetical protein
MAQSTKHPAQEHHQHAAAAHQAAAHHHHQAAHQFLEGQARAVLEIPSLRRSVPVDARRHSLALLLGAPHDRT